MLQKVRQIILQFTLDETRQSLKEKQIGEREALKEKKGRRKASDEKSKPKTVA